MKIQWLGHSCFLLTSDNDTRIVTDPFDGSVGYRLPEVAADAVTTSHDHYDHNYVKAVKGWHMHLKEPGSYAVGDVKVLGVPAFHDDAGGSKRGRNVIFRFEIDGIAVCHLGDLGHRLAPQQVAAIGPVDVLLIPVGGKYTLDARGAAEVVAQLKPKVVIPMHYSTKLLKFDIANADAFLAAMGNARKAGSTEIVLSRDNLDAMAGTVVLDYE